MRAQRLRQILHRPSNPPCIYHPGPPEFHEGQKGWKCCKPRVLTFDEFLTIPPCTTGSHSAVDDGPKVEFSDTSQIGVEEVQPKEEEPVRKVRPLTERAKESMAASVAAAGTSGAVVGTPESGTPQPGQQVVEEDSDDEEESIAEGVTCKRKTCGETFKGGKRMRSEEKCIFHPGVPVFHEGSKGYTCCKRRVLEFDEFMKIQGCKEREGHCFVGKREKAREAEKRAASKASGGTGEEAVEEVRNDFYQTPSSVIVSFFLKKIKKDEAKVVFGTETAEEGGNGYVDLDLPTADNKRFTKRVVFWSDIDPEKSAYKVLGTKLELTVVKAGDGQTGWPVLRKGDRETGERIQVGRAGRA
ncbi:Cysteine and histidine-rich domain-containing protein 1 [Cyphellophora attinorum]|uniref:Cysteine and histidine-rich domain-containing protein 1 n=1 Tax=Cyphellophora attinorum TaxID=1664694 RepID=A0A0N1H933_9EURO|nr:Cysteine and histidine-rich domain-containing protein 1 [Phialophora attinorum]KPI43784.1 Cysteine and histidine-rich domain-containing protein 1 [Phialophora attinorum]